MALVRDRVIEVGHGRGVLASLAIYAREIGRGVHILWGNGTVTNVRIREPSVAGCILILDGIFEILSLNGSYMLPPAPPTATRITVQLRGVPRGFYVGGIVFGELTAVGRVRLTVAADPLPNGGYNIPPSVGGRGGGRGRGRGRDGRGGGVGGGGGVDGGNVAGGMPRPELPPRIQSRLDAVAF